MTTLVHEGRALDPAVRPESRELSIALLGLGQVGSAVATLALDPPAALTRRLRIIGALVRRPARVREPALNGRVTLTTDAVTLLESPGRAGRAARRSGTGTQSNTWKCYLCTSFSYVS